MPIVRNYLRRSKNDEGKQQFSLDVQRAGAREFLDRLGLPSRDVIEYVDDGRAGDDFLTRTGLRQLLADAAPGDVVICRDQSRLGRDAIEVTLVVRDLVRDRGCRLFYYVNGNEVQFANAIDAATTFIQGTGHQMELEAIRSRVREALRQRVRDGRVAGGVCYGYRLERRADASGRKFTAAVVDHDQARIMVRIFEEYASHRGLKLIAKSLNDEGVPPPAAGKRGTGTWTPGCIRAMLRNPRYRGVYVHGKVKKVRTGGVLARVKADPTEMVTVEIPEWRIVDDALWFAVEARFAKRAPHKKMNRSRAKYALTGIARCAACGGAIGCASTPINGGFTKTYACRTNRERGSRACAVSVRQPMIDIEAALVAYLERSLLTDETVEIVLDEVRRAAEATFFARPEDVAALESELAETRAAQKRLAKAVAMSDDIPELVSEMRQGALRVQRLEARLESSRNAPHQVATFMERIESSARSKMTEMRSWLCNPDEQRRLFLSMFPKGLDLTPGRDGSRAVWEISGGANLQLVSEADSCRLMSDPKVPGPKVREESTFEFAVLDGRAVEEGPNLRHSSKPDAWRCRRGRPRAAISS